MAQKLVVGEGHGGEKKALYATLNLLIDEQSPTFEARQQNWAIYAHGQPLPSGGPVCLHAARLTQAVGQGAHARLPIRPLVAQVEFNMHTGQPFIQPNSE